jgi:hypothetical protein
LDQIFISWHINKQHVVLTSIETEYIVVGTAKKELFWLQALLTELGYIIQLPNTLYCDI